MNYSLKPTLVVRTARQKHRMDDECLKTMLTLKRKLEKDDPKVKAINIILNSIYGTIGRKPIDPYLEVELELYEGLDPSTLPPGAYGV